MRNKLTKAIFLAGIYCTFLAVCFAGPKHADITSDVLVAMKA